MQLRLGAKRQQDWLVASILAAASLQQLSPGPGTVRQQVLGLSDRVRAVIHTYESGLATPGPPS